MGTCIKQLFRFVRGCCVRKRARDGKVQGRAPYPASCSSSPRLKDAMHDKPDPIAFDSGAPPHGQTQRSWQRRRNALARHMWDILDNTAGMPNLKETLDELRECDRQICSESVRKHTRLVEILQARMEELCITITCIASKEVPEADNIIDQLVECDNILAIFEEAVSPWTTGQAAKVSPAIAPPKPGALPHSAAQATMLDATGPVSTTGLISAQRTGGAASCRDAHVVDIHVDTHTDASSTVMPGEDGEDAPLLPPLSAARATSFRRLSAPTRSLWNGIMLWGGHRASRVP
ncbi:hypothetical protein CVIRNUC_004078 [Coccomyxa viridis]|uniref:Uncharacterized protein n=1 Tax=Coccomyxa viridis TaxID=1274662 RepID=A0AAV1I0T4_9CHLO|nr:hypothetical protein CVIRNUC_004078 [Coccomyxa viridis]